MNIGENTKILELIKEYPFLEDFIMKYNEKFLILSDPVMRDQNGKYLGTLEVSQDITDIKRLDKEKRLLDWE